MRVAGAATAGDAETRYGKKPEDAPDAHTVSVRR